MVQQVVCNRIRRHRSTCVVGLCALFVGPDTVASWNPLLVRQCSQSTQRSHVDVTYTRTSSSLTAKPPREPLSDASDPKFDVRQPADAAASASSPFEIPANLRRKVRAERPALGHVVPRDGRKQPQQSRTSGGSSPSRLKAQGKVLASPTQGRNTKANNNGMFPSSRLKIAAGTARGSRLDSPNVYIRPMMGKVKEAVYSTLTSFGLYDGSSSTRHLDIFAGSGSVGLESLSRGAIHCTFVDASDDCCACIQRNLETTGLLGQVDDPTTTTTTQLSSDGWRIDDGRARICCADAFTVLREPQTVGIPLGTTYDIVTLCPPYEEIVYGDLLDAVVASPLVQDDTVILIEYPIELQCLPPAIVVGSRTAVGVRNRKYGRTVLALYVINPTGRLPPAASSRPEEFVSI